MRTAVSPNVLTPEDLLALPDAKNYELVDGQLVERDVSVLSSWIGGELYGRVREFVRNNDLGYVWPADNGIQCFPKRPFQVRKPDVSFVRKERLKPELFQTGHLRIAPDLAGEVLSPREESTTLDVKITEYQEAGIPVIWIVNPDARTVRTYRLDGSTKLLHDGDELTCPDFLPGFRCLVRDLFPPLELVPLVPNDSSDE